jgi:hypothetical protein
MICGTPTFDHPAPGFLWLSGTKQVLLLQLLLVCCSSTLPEGWLRTPESCQLSSEGNKNSSALLEPSYQQQRDSRLATAASDPLAYWPAVAMCMAL